MSILTSALRQETAFVCASQPHQTVRPGWAGQGSVAGLYNFTLQTVGGAVFLQDCVPGAEAERGVHWQIENSSTGTLHLTEFTVHGGACGPHISIETGYQLFPSLASAGTSDSRLLLTALLSNGFLMHMQLRSSSASEALLTGFSSSSLRLQDLSLELAALGTPTSLAATADGVLVGGSMGSVLCIPLATLEDSNTTRCFELRDSSWALTKLIPGMLFRPRQPAALACTPVTLACRQLLLVSYDDGMLRAFHVARRQQVATLELETPGAASQAALGGGSRHLTPTYVAAESSQPANGQAGSAVTLVVQFEAADKQERFTFSYTLSASGGGRLSLSSPTPLAVEAGAVVSEARVSGDTVWLLLRSQGRDKVLGYDRTSGAVVSSAVLAEAASEHSGGVAATGGNGQEIDQELWEWMLQAFPQELSAEAQICQQVLVPGQTCRSSLRDALSYHGAQLSTSDVDAAPYTVLRGWIQAAVMAIQRRIPTASAAECWQAFLVTYRAAWARRHPPLGLVLHHGSPEWLGLARGGSVLCVLRRGTGVEALLGADVAGSLEMPQHLDAVHRCASEAGALLGPLAQEACLTLLVSGVDPLERLVPRLCELWHGGPGTAGASADGTASRGSSMGSGAAAATAGSMGGAGVRAAALTDNAREAQQRWRQRRLQLVISMGQRLGSLSQVSLAIKSYLVMLRLLGSQTSAELAAAGPGSVAHSLLPSRAASSFLVATCRQVSRAAAAAARDAALLLGLVLQQCALGCVPLDREALVRLETALLPEACGLLRRAALGLWLTGTPASHDEAADMEPAVSALRHLRLGSPQAKARTDWDAAAADASQPSFLRPQSQQQQQPGTAATYGEASLAARLLPAFCASYASGRGGRLDLLTGAESAGLLFTLYLQYGEHTSAPLAARVLQLGYHLFQAGEYGHLADLSSLAGATGSSEAGPQFLRGLGIICALALERQQAGGAAAGGGMGAGRGPQHGAFLGGPGLAGTMVGAAGGGIGSGQASRRAERIADAAGCFFRAAASLAAEAGDTLRAVLQDLRSDLTGESSPFGLPHGPAAAASSAVPANPSQQQQQRREVALLQLRFCEAVMQLFEREGAPEGAVVFASAALEHLKTAYGPSANQPGDATASTTATADPAGPLLPGEDALMRAAAAEAASERSAREGRLWSNIYSYCVEMRQYDRAYAALLANPLPAARLQSLRHLVHVLAQDGQLQTLCTLPFAGVAVLPATDGPGPAAAAAGGAHSELLSSGGCRTVSLLSEALDLLHRRAHNCDLSETPQPYQVLYDFLVCRSDYKGAARAMAAYAWRLRAEAAAGSGGEAVEEALRAYDLAICCLSLLDPDDAFLDLTDPWVERLAPYNHTPHGAGDQLASTPSKSPGGTAGAAGGAAAASRGGTALAGGGGGGPVLGAAAAAFVSAAPIATVRTLQRERTLLFYSVLVASRVTGLEPMRQWDNEEAILRQLLLMGRYEGALALVADCYGGQGSDPWVRALEAVVAALAAHCTRLQLQDGGVLSGGPPLPPTDLFADDPDSAAAAAFFGVSGTAAAAVAATLGGRAAPLWTKLRQLLAETAAADAFAERSCGGGGGGGVRVGWLLRDAAAEAVLRTDPRVDLPQWLLDLFLAPLAGAPDAPAAAMGSSACGPASLLSLYLRHDRLAAAVELVAGQVERWGREDVRLRRRHCAAWMPYPQLELLHTKLTIAQQLGQERSGALLAQLNAALANHVELVATDAERLEPQRAAAALGAGGGAGPSAVSDSDMVLEQHAPHALVFGSAVTSPMSPEGAVGSPLFGMGMSGGLRLFGQV